MALRVNEFLALLLEMLAELVWPSLGRRLAGTAMGLLPDIPIIAGRWVGSFQDPRPCGCVANQVHLELHQFGRRLRGTGHLEGAPGDQFEFRGRVKRNIFHGSFSRKDAHNLAGTGAFVLKVTAHAKTMAGNCMWYDGELDRVWESPYYWRRPQ